jgi:hypothetical protein
MAIWMEKTRSLLLLTIRRPMLAATARQHIRLLGFVHSLLSLHVGDGETRGQPRILSVHFLCASPSRIAHQVQIRRIGRDAHTVVAALATVAQMSLSVVRRTGFLANEVLQRRRTNRERSKRMHEEHGQM